VAKSFFLVEFCTLLGVTNPPPCVLNMMCYSADLRESPLVFPEPRLILALRRTTVRGDRFQSPSPTGATLPFFSTHCFATEFFPQPFLPVPTVGGPSPALNSATYDLLPLAFSNRWESQVTGISPPPSTFATSSFPKPSPLVVCGVLYLSYLFFFSATFPCAASPSPRC